MNDMEYGKFRETKLSLSRTFLKSLSSKDVSNSNFRVRNSGFWPFLAFTIRSVFGLLWTGKREEKATEELDHVVDAGETR